MTTSHARAVCVITGSVLVAGVLTGGLAHAATDDVRINEVVTTGDVNDSVELYNTGTAAVDISGWIIKDDKDSSDFTIAPGTTLGRVLPASPSRPVAER